MGADDFLARIIWTQHFLQDQGITLDKNLLAQDNKSAILLQENGRRSLGKRSRAINIRYFAIKDHVDRGELKFFHCSTEKMVADYFTKPLQGVKFQEFRDMILGMKKVDTTGASR